MSFLIAADSRKETVFDALPYMGHLSVKDSTIMDLSAPSIRRQQAAANIAEMKQGLWPFDPDAEPPDKVEAEGLTAAKIGQRSTEAAGT